MLRLVLQHGPEKFQEAGLWSLVENAGEYLRRKLRLAHQQLAEFGVTKVDLVGPLYFRLGTSKEVLIEIMVRKQFHGEN